MLKKLHHLGIYTFFLLFLTISITQAEEADNTMDSFLKKSSVTFDVTYASKYIGRRGVDYFDNGSVLHPSININLSDTGWYFGIWGAIPIEKGCTDPFGDKCEDWVEYDYYLGYANAFLPGSRFETSYDVSYYYFDYPKQKKEDLHDMTIAFAHPELLPQIGPSKPTLSWGVGYNWRAESPGRDRHEYFVGLSYDLPVATQTISLSSDVLWDTGAGGGINEFGMTRVRMGASTSFSYKGFAFKPSLHYQSKTKQTVPKAWLESEFWFKFSVSYSF